MGRAQAKRVASCGQIQAASSVWSGEGAHQPWQSLGLPGGGKKRGKKREGRRKKILGLGGAEGVTFILSPVGKRLGEVAEKLGWRGGQSSLFLCRAPLLRGVFFLCWGAQAPGLLTWGPAQLPPFLPTLPTPASQPSEKVRRLLGFGILGRLRGMGFDHLFCSDHGTKAS